MRKRPLAAEIDDVTRAAVQAAATNPAERERLLRLWAEAVGSAAADAGAGVAAIRRELGMPAQRPAPAMAADTLTSPQLALRLGIARSTLHSMIQADPKLRGCILRATRRSTTWSVAKLRAAGYLT